MTNEECCSWRTVLGFLGLLVLAVFAACASGGLRPDEAMAQLGVRDTQQAGDATVVIEGDQPPPVGFHFLRFQQGEIATGSVALVVPPAQCRPEGARCVHWAIRRPDGQVIGDDVPRGQVRVVIAVRDLFGSATAELGHRGPFFVLLTVKWVDEQGNDRESRAEGIIEVRVVSQGYQSLNQTPSSREFAWDWIDQGRNYRMTTALRAYAGMR